MPLRCRSRRFERIAVGLFLAGTWTSTERVDTIMLKLQLLAILLTVATVSSGW
jgi:hypothetical protein